MDTNIDVYNQFTHEYQDYSLYPPERAILERFRGKWHSMRMLDIGIGTGRTTYTFAAVADEYVGIDYAAGMVEAARRAIPRADHVTLLHADARDLSAYRDKPFDFAMFSLNGLDSVALPDREQILREVRQVLRPEGHLYFSSHTLRGFSPSPPVRRFRPGDPVRSAFYMLKDLRHRNRMRRTHRQLDLRELRQRDWAVLKTGDHDFTIDVMHVNPVFQLQVLQRLGFRVLQTLDPAGAPADPANTDAAWLYYLCQPAAAVH